MALELMDEHEQGERVRAWLRDNGTAILGGIAIGVGLLWGWQWWGGSQLSHRLDAAAQYEALDKAVTADDRDGAKTIAAALARDFNDTPYALLASLRVSERQLQNGESAAAIESLQKLLAETKDPALASLVRLRLARMQIAGGQGEQALKTLEGVAPQQFVGMTAELRGDALHALGRGDEAREAYAAAYSGYEETSPARRLVELKLTDAGGSVPAAAPASASASAPAGA